MSDRQLHVRERANRFSLGVLSVLGVGLLVLAFGGLPAGAAAILRATLLSGVTGLAIVEALRHFQHGLRPGSLRWTRLVIGVGFGALTLGQALHHWGLLEETAPDRALGLGMTCLSFALLLDLRERDRQSRAGALARAGIIVGAAGSALLGVTLLVAAWLPWSTWWPLLLVSTVLIAVAGGIYLRVRSRSDVQAA